MLDHETVNKLRYMKLTGIAEAITDRLCSQAYNIVIKGKKSMREAARD